MARKKTETPNKKPEHYHETLVFVEGCPGCEANPHAPPKPWTKVPYRRPLGQRIGRNEDTEKLYALEELSLVAFKRAARELSRVLGFAEGPDGPRHFYQEALPEALLSFLECWDSQAVALAIEVWCEKHPEAVNVALSREHVQIIPAKHRFYRVIITAWGPEAVAVECIKAIRKATGLDLANAKFLFDAKLPTCIAFGLQVESAEHARRLLEDAGATVRLEEEETS